MKNQINKKLNLIILVIVASVFSIFCGTRAAQGSVQINNNYITISINDSGCLTSVKYHEAEQLKDIGIGKPLGKIYFSDGTSKSPKRFQPLGDDKYEISYLDSDVKMTLRILPRPGYFIFTVVSVLNPNSEELNTVELFNFQVKNIAQPDGSKEWAEDAGSDELFMHALPLNINAACDVNLSSGYTCKAGVQMGLEGASGILITAPKSLYISTIRDIIIENNLPYLAFVGRWFRQSNQVRESYLFAQLSHENHMDILDYAKRGNFKQLLLRTPVIHGHYDQPKSFSSQQEFYSDMDKFIDAGIKIGIHSHFNRISPQDPLFRPQNLYKERVAYLVEDIGANAATIALDNNLLENPVFLHYSTAGTPYRSNRQSYVIGDEIIDGVTGDGQITLCNRGKFDTAKSSHAKGAAVYILPFTNPESFFIDPSQETIVRQSAESFAALAKRLSVNFIYADGYSFVPKMGTDASLGKNYIEKYGLLPYLEKMDRLPIVQYGTLTNGSYPYYYSNRGATWDGTFLKDKEFARDYKVKKILDSNPFGNISYEMGWIKFHQASFSNGNYDYDATSFDDIHYIMTKALALETSVGIELVDFSPYDKNARIRELFDLVGLYHQLINEDIESGLVSQNIKDYLKEPGREAELNNISGYNLVEKKVGRQYAVWDAGDSYTYNLNNPFARQRIKVQIRPRFDYYPFSDQRHKLITDFSGISPSDVTTSGYGADISYSIGSGGIFISNKGSKSGNCKIEISLSPDVNLRYKRGVGISVTGAGNGESIIVSLRGTDYGCRDYKFSVDFSGKREILLGDPITTLGDSLPGISANWRSWRFNFSRINRITIYITDIKPGGNLQLHSLKGLKEKSKNSMLVNPSIEVNGEKITFPVKLFVSDVSAHILEYDGYNNKYELYNSNLQYLSKGTIIDDNIMIESGQNEIKISSDTSNTEYCTRADVRVSVYDDEDNDGIPTNGDYYSVNYTPHNKSNSFYDDNLPKEYNLPPGTTACAIAKGSSLVYESGKGTNGDSSVYPVNPAMAKLDGSSSTNAGSYHWIQTGGPAAQVRSPNSAVTSFVSPRPQVGDEFFRGTVLTFMLVVNEGTIYEARSEPVRIILRLRGDVDGNNRVLTDDNSIVSSAFTEKLNHRLYDINGDRKVDEADIDIARKNIGRLRSN